MQISSTKVDKKDAVTLLNEVCYGLPLGSGRA